MCACVCVYACVCVCVCMRVCVCVSAPAASHSLTVTSAHPLALYYLQPSAPGRQSNREEKNTEDEGIGAILING